MQARFIASLLLASTAAFAAQPTQPPVSQPPAPPHAGEITQIKQPPVMSVSDMIGAYGDSVPLKATLKDAATNQPLSGLQIAFAVDGTAIGDALTGGNGEARVQFPVETKWTVGQHSISATFHPAATGSQLPSTKGSATINILKTATKMGGSCSGATNLAVEFGGSFKYQGWLERVGDKKGLEGREVKILRNGQVVKTTATDSKGFFVAELTVPQIPTGADFQMTSEFEGDTHYTGSAAPTCTVTELPKLLGTVYIRTQVLPGDYRVGMPLTAICSAKKQDMLDADGQKGVKVSIRLQDEPMGGGTTNDDGNVAVMHLPQHAGGLWVNCHIDSNLWKDGTTSALGQTFVTIKPGYTKLEATGGGNVKSGQMFTVSATLLRVDGKPLSNAKITVGSSSGMTNVQGKVTFQAKAEGQFGLGTVQVPVHFAGNTDWDKSEDKITVHISPADN